MKEISLPLCTHCECFSFIINSWFIVFHHFYCFCCDTFSIFQTNRNISVVNKLVLCGKRGGIMCLYHKIHIGTHFIIDLDRWSDAFVIKWISHYISTLMNLLSAYRICVRYDYYIFEILDLISFENILNRVKRKLVVPIEVKVNLIFV